MRFPNQGNWSVAHGKDFTADIVRTQNMDFSRPGFASLARNANVLYTDGDNSNFGDPIAIVPIASVYYIVTDDEVFSYSASTNSVTNLTTSSMPTLGADTDACSFQTYLHVSGGTVVKWWDGNSWEAGVTSLGTTYPHPLCVVEQLNQLAVGDGNTVKTYNTSYSLQATLTIPAEYIVTGLRWRQNYVYIFTRNIYGGSAKMFIWTGTGTSAQAAYDVGADWIYAGYEFGGTIVVVISTGQLLRYNGGGFDELAAFPVYYSPYQWTSDASVKSLKGRMSNRGIVADGGVLLLNVDGRVNVPDSGYVRPYITDQPSGIWEFDPEVGLYHLAGFPDAKYNTISISSLSDSTFTMASAHGATTGDPVRLVETTGITGITENAVMFAIVTGNATLKLAITPEDAREGRAVTISGTVSGDSLSFYNKDSFGCTDNIEAGPIALFSQAEINPFIGSRFFWGGVAIDSAGADSNVFGSLGMGRNVGSMVTSPIESGSALEIFQKIATFVNNVRLSGEKVIVKYRITKDKTEQSRPASITWSSNTTFTVDPYTQDVRGLEEGDEITVISGGASGFVCKVSELDSPPTSVTISEEAPGISAGDVSTIVTEKWKEVAIMAYGSVDMDQLDVIKQSIDADNSAYMQFKIEFRGFSLAMRSFNAISAGAEQQA